MRKERPTVSSVGHIEKIVAASSSNAQKNSRRLKLRTKNGLRAFLPQNLMGASMLFHK
jgi:hypothetical protein